MTGNVSLPAPLECRLRIESQKSRILSVGKILEGAMINDLAKKSRALETNGRSRKN